MESCTWVLLARMQHTQNLDKAGTGAVNNDVVGMHDNFAGACNPAMTIQVRMLRKSLRCILNGLVQILRCRDIAVTNEIKDGP